MIIWQHAVCSTFTMQQFYFLLYAAITLLIATFTTDATREECCHVVKLTATKAITASADNAWVFAATMSSPYEATTGWDKYCDAFEIRDAGDGTTVFTTRILAHPHPDEQPFTRSTSTVELPSGVRTVMAVARDSVVGYCGDAVEMEMDPSRTTIVAVLPTGGKDVAVTSSSTTTTGATMAALSSQATAAASSKSSDGPTRTQTPAPTRAPIMSSSSSNGEPTRAPSSASSETSSSSLTSTGTMNAASIAWVFTVFALFIASC